MNILKIIQHNDLSVKRTMPEVLKLLNPQVKLPSLICNRTNKVKRFKGDSKMAIGSILPQLYIGPYCKRENLKTFYLHGNKQHLLITTDYVTNGLIYELEQYRWKEKLSIDSALEWTECFFPMTTHQGTSAQAHNHAWKTVYDRVTSLKCNVKKDKSTIDIQQEHLEGFLLLQYIPPSARLSNRKQLVDALQNPPMNKIRSSTNPLVSMAAYQGELMGKYVRNTEAKITRCQKKEVVMQNEIAAIHKTTHALQTTVTNLSAKNEKLQQTTAKAKQEKIQTEDRLKELKSDLTASESAFNPRNVKRREETNETFCFGVFIGSQNVKLGSLLEFAWNK